LYLQQTSGAIFAFLISHEPVIVITIYLMKILCSTVLMNSNYSE